MSVYAIVLAGGSGRRMGSEEPKQFLPLAGRPMLVHTLEAFEQAGSIDRVVLVTAPGQESRCRRDIVAVYGFGKIAAVTAGGAERQDSVAEGLKVVGADAEVVAIHDGARPLILPEHIDAVVAAAQRDGAAVLGTPVSDTIKEVAGWRVQRTLDRSRLWSVQTPQAFRTALIRRAHAVARKDGYLGTDDTVLVERLGVPVTVVAGRRDNLKLTIPEDLVVAEEILRRREGASPALRIGQGYDVHRLVEGRPLVLGGVTIAFDRGLLGHSDADVLSHAIADAILGGLNAGDIGRHFPDTDAAYAGISSLVLLTRVAKLVRQAGGQVVNVDATVMAQRPKLAPHIPEMQMRVAASLGISADCVSIKATTTEGLGFVGQEAGMAAQAVALIDIEGKV